MITYEIKKSPLNSRVENGSLYACPHHRGKVSTKQLCKDISGASTFTPGDVQGVIYALAERIEHYLRDGYSVEINELGIFSVTLQVPKGTNSANKVGTSGVKFGKVKFRMANELKQNMKHAHISRKSPKAKEPKTADQRYASILNLAQNRNFITIANCMSINDCTRYQATADLKALEQQGALSMQSINRQKCYFIVS